ncbi:MAG: FG-GAP repeat domain-containing protein, partial [Planctomycetota bacterium]
NYVEEATLDITDPTYWKATTTQIQEQQIDDQMQAACGDIDNDGEFEIITSHGNDEGINIWNFNGVSYEHEMLIWEYSASLSGIRIADIDDDGRVELAIAEYDQSRFYDYDENGYVASPLGQDVSTYSIGTPTIMDWDLDGDVEAAYGDYDGQLQVYMFNDTGAWTREFGPGIDTEYNSYSSAMGDIDDDGVIEIVLGSNNDNMYVYNSTSTTAEWNYNYGYGDIGHSYGDGFLISGEKDQGAYGVGAPTITLGEVQSAPPQSRIDNTGSRNITAAYLTMRIQNYSSGTWDNVSTIVSLQQVNIPIDDYIKIDQIWFNASGWNTTSSPNGTYRVYVELTTASGTLLYNNDDGTPMNVSYEFELDAIAPIISDNEPTNNTNVADPVLSEENTYEYTISITTDEPSVCKFSAQSGESWEDMFWISIEYQTTHYHRLQLIDEGTYDYYFKCMDSAGNIASEYNLHFTTEWNNRPTASQTTLSPELFNQSETVTLSATCYDLDTSNQNNDGMEECRFVGTQEGTAYNSSDWLSCTGSSCSCSCTITPAGVGSTGCPDVNILGDWSYQVECRDYYNITDSKDMNDTGVKANVTWDPETQTNIIIIEEEQNSGFNLSYQHTVEVNNTFGGESREAGWYHDASYNFYNNVDEWNYYQGTNCSGTEVPFDEFLITTDYYARIYYINSFGNGAFQDYAYKDDLGTYNRGCGIADFDNDGDYDFISG